MALGSRRPISAAAGRAILDRSGYTDGARQRERLGAKIEGFTLELFVQRGPRAKEQIRSGASERPPEPLTEPQRDIGGNRKADRVGDRPPRAGDKGYDGALKHVHHEHERDTGDDGTHGGIDVAFATALAHGKSRTKWYEVVEPAPHDERASGN